MTALDHARSDLSIPNGDFQQPARAVAIHLRSVHLVRRGVPSEPGMLDAGHCPEAQQLGFDRGMLKRVLSVFLLSGFHERALSLAVAYRLQQCRPGDVAALAQLASVLASSGFDDPLGPLYSRILRNNIVLSEMWEPGALAARSCVGDLRWRPTRNALPYRRPLE